MTLETIAIAASCLAGGIITGIYIEIRRRERANQRRLLRFAQTEPQKQAEDAIASVYANFPNLPGLEYVIVSGPEGEPAVLRKRDSVPGLAVMSEGGDSYIRWDVTRFGDAVRNATLVSGVPSTGIVVGEGE